LSCACAALFTDAQKVAGISNFIEWVVIDSQLIVRPARSGTSLRLDTGSLSSMSNHSFSPPPGAGGTRSAQHRVQRERHALAFGRMHRDHRWPFGSWPVWMRASSSGSAPSGVARVRHRRAAKNSLRHRLFVLGC